LNLAVTGELRIVPALSVGANLDLAGLNAGSARTVGGILYAPPRGALFLYGDRDRGALNSDFYLRLQASSHLAIRGGLSHYLTGYRTEGDAPEARYLRFETVPFAAVQWRP
jgi:hypothetical protein